MSAAPSVDRLVERYAGPEGAQDVQGEPRRVTPAPKPRQLSPEEEKRRRKDAHMRACETDGRKPDLDVLFACVPGDLSKAYRDAENKGGGLVQRIATLLQSAGATGDVYRRDKGRAGVEAVAGHYREGCQALEREVEALARKMTDAGAEFRQSVGLYGEPVSARWTWPGGAPKWGDHVENDLRLAARQLAEARRNLAEAERLPELEAQVLEAQAEKRAAFDAMVAW